MKSKFKIACCVGAATFLIMLPTLHPTKSETDNYNVDLELELKKRNKYIEYLETKVSDLETSLSTYNATFEYNTAAAPLYDVPMSTALQQYTYDMCVFYNIEDYYETVLALMWQESNFNPDLISTTDDYGIMQINACNHEYLQNELGIVDFLNPYENIRGGLHLLSTLIHKYDGNDHRVLMCYNMGERRAAELWSDGIYTSTYSVTVLSKLDELNKK